ncbi:unnamed protein product [Protopolystoma xenopodis]|uniref:Dynein attachment factor N-terminal domain-containing protein n=1 Tax=Protopolystoma xenopodis TaxID=117903 RepID=A0A448WIP4_9PLAT|nr:unnamed protein product [Protopolystoma xenopodis]
MARLGIKIDKLESELNSAVQRDSRYWLENDTKINAVQQGVPTYEHFRQLVAGCHLKPLDKNEDITNLRAVPSWNHVLCDSLDGPQLEALITDSKAFRPATLRSVSD